MLKFLIRIGCSCYADDEDGWISNVLNPLKKILADWVANHPPDDIIDDFKKCIKKHDISDDLFEISDHTIIESLYKFDFKYRKKS